MKYHGRKSVRLPLYLAFLTHVFCSVEGAKMTTQYDIRGWPREPARPRATHLLFGCDTFDWDDYPGLPRRGTNQPGVCPAHHALPGGSQADARQARRSLAPAARIPASPSVRRPLLQNACAKGAAGGEAAVIRLGRAGYSIRLDESFAEFLAGLEARAALGRYRDGLPSPRITALSLLLLLHDKATKSAQIDALVCLKCFGNRFQNGLQYCFD